MAGSLRIRQIDGREQGRFLGLARSLFQKARMVVRERDEVFMAYDADEPVAFLHLRPLRRTLYLQGIGVCPPYRHRGIGRALLGLAMRRAVGKSPDGLALRVRARNADAVRLYLSEGFWLGQLSERVWTLRWRPLS